MSYTAIFPPCPRCNGSVGDGRFCLTCDVLNSYPDAGAFKASRWRRLGGAILDSLLMVVTFYIGWLVWLYFTAPDGQTPAKKLLNMYILKDTGEPVTAGQVWLRDVLVETIVFGVISAFVVGVATLIDAVWILFDKDHQTVHDKMLNTIVIHAPRERVRSDNPYQTGFTAPTGSRPSAAGSPPRDPSMPPPPATGPISTVESREDRLRELQRLADQGFITEDEYAERRRRILDDL
ncbi:MAG TPA: RDD family protein [Dehalococcoidia bacterium]|nr:RDD family protein [Dehalococcoidia bacterium]